MQRAALEGLEQRIDRQIRDRLPGAAVQRVTVLQYGDDPEVEPGELIVRVVVEAEGDSKERARAIEAFHPIHREALEEFWRDLSVYPEFRSLEIRFGEEIDLGYGHTGNPAIALGRDGRSQLGGGVLTPVMAGLPPADLETLDVLVTSGIAASRAEAVRWALGRIHERPAYERLLERAREIEDLKAQF